RWAQTSVTFVHPVDLGGVTPPGETNRPTIVLPRRDPPAGSREEERPPHPRGEPRTNATAAPGVTNPSSNAASVASNLAPVALNAAGNDSAPINPPERRPGRPRFGRPPWMNEAEYKSLVESRGLHGLVIVMSSEAFRRACAQDLWMRWIIGCFASVSGVGLGFAWRNLVKSSELQMRLLRASELNTHLKEMNLAAAGLAHETRNPLNIIRGLAQMISKQKDAPPEVRG